MKPSLLLATAALLLISCSNEQKQLPAVNVVEASIEDLQAALQAKRATSRQLVEQYLARIEQYDDALHAIIIVNKDALADADRLDRERAAGTVRGPLHGIPIVIKDNIDVAAGGMPTTAGSLALTANVPAKDAEVVRRLREAGVIVLAKTNLSEWANIRANDSSSGWSAVGGLTRNPYALDRTACGSSSGSAVAVAASFAAVAVGTETNGSVTCPSSMTALVGLKPTVGLVSRSGIVPISRSQDTAGPIARNVKDVAVLLSAMAGADSRDEATRDADAHREDYVRALNAGALKGTRIGVLKALVGFSPPADRVFAGALETLKAQGAELVDIEQYDTSEISKRSLLVLLTEFKAGVNVYLQGTPPAVKTRTLADVIAFNRSEPREMPWFGQDLFEEADAAAGLDDAAYIEARDTEHRIAREEGIDRLLREHGVAALIGPSTGPAWMIDLVNGDHFVHSASSLPAVAGYPHLTVPMGEIAGLPVGLSFIGPAWSEAMLLSLGYAFEQAAHARKVPTLPAPRTSPEMP